MKKKNAVSTLRLITSVESTSASSLMGIDGTCHPRSEQGVAPHSTPCVSASLETVKVITAMCLALMDQTMSPDCMWLALRNAEDMAVAAGVSQEKAEDIVRQIGLAWLSRRGRNPMSSLF